MLFLPLQEAALQILNILYQTIEIIIYDNSFIEENTLQSFKEQQVS